MEVEDDDSKPAVAKNYYSRPLWWSETEQAVMDRQSMTSNRDGVNGIYFAVSKDNLDFNPSEIMTPDISETMEDNLVLTSTRNGVNDISESGGTGNVDLDNYSRQNLSSEIVEIVEDGKSITSNQDRRAEDIYVAVGKDDLDVVKWVLDRAVSPSCRIFLIHISPSITLIPTLVGKLPRSQSTQQQVSIHLKEEINRRKNLLQKYIQLSTDAQVTAETLLLESNDIAKAILDLIPILNINNLVIGIKKPPHSRGKNKLSKGEFVKKNAPEFCDVALVYNGNQVVNSRDKDSLASIPGDVSHGRGRSKGNFLHCTCFSGRE